MTEEGLLKQACVHLLDLQENLGRLKYIRNNSFAGKITRKDGSCGYINNAKKGAPDLFVFLKQGITLHIELKASQGQQSEVQKAWQAKAEKLGHQYYIIRDLDELIRIIALNNYV